MPTVIEMNINNFERKWFFKITRSQRYELMALSLFRSLSLSLSSFSSSLHRETAQQQSCGYIETVSLDYTQTTLPNRV